MDGNPERENAERTDASRGRAAARPRELSRSGWRDVLLRTKREMGQDEIGLVSAGAAFYLFLALFPALAALVSLYALIADPAQVQQQIGSLTAIPADVRGIVEGQLEREAQRSDGTLRWTLAGSVLLALWSASKGVRALMRAMNVAYDEREKRGVVRRILVGLAFTGGAALLAIAAAGALVVVPGFLGNLRLGAAARWGVAIVSWAVLVAGFVVAVSALYRWGPSRACARWRWITPGAAVAVALWTAASALFSLYVAKFGSYGETYGSLAAVVVVLLWLWISAMAIVLGAELNSEMERQTRRDTTTGAPRPMGERGAHVADTLGRSP